MWEFDWGRSVVFSDLHGLFIVLYPNFFEISPIS